jgi:hypothetical protein
MITGGNEETKKAALYRLRTPLFDNLLYLLEIPE